MRFLILTPMTIIARHRAAIQITFKCERAHRVVHPAIAYRWRRGVVASLISARCVYRGLFDRAVLTACHRSISDNQEPNTANEPPAVRGGLAREGRGKLEEVKVGNAKENLPRSRAHPGSTAVASFDKFQRYRML
jgi:hypothetical protein